MKKIFFLLQVLVIMILTSCSGNAIAALNQQREADTAKYQSEYGVIKNKLELSEANFNAYRRIVFYNVRLGETVFACEGFAHLSIDEDGDVEIVVKTGENKHYQCRQGNDVTSRCDVERNGFEEAANDFEEGNLVDFHEMPVIHDEYDSHRSKQQHHENQCFNKIKNVSFHSFKLLQK